MATSQETRIVSVVAGSTVNIYRFVAMAADGQYDHPSAQGRIDGIAAEDGITVGKALAMVIPNGAIAKVEAGAVFSAGQRVASDANGKAIAAVSGAGNFRGGIALDASGADGDIIRIQFLVDEDQVT